MADPEVESVSYGLSSLRAETARDSLHTFKVSIGLEAVPVGPQGGGAPAAAAGREPGWAGGGPAVRERAPRLGSPRRPGPRWSSSCVSPPSRMARTGDAMTVTAPRCGRPTAPGEVAALLHRRVFPGYESTRLGAVLPAPAGRRTPGRPTRRSWWPPDETARSSATWSAHRPRPSGGQRPAGPWPCSPCRPRRRPRRAPPGGPLGRPAGPLLRRSPAALARGAPVAARVPVRVEAPPHEPELPSRGADRGRPACPAARGAAPTPSSAASPPGPVGAHRVADLVVDAPNASAHRGYERNGWLLDDGDEVDGTVRYGWPCRARPPARASRRGRCMRAAPRRRAGRRTVDVDALLGAEGERQDPGTGHGPGPQDVGADHVDHAVVQPGRRERLAGLVEALLARGCRAAVRGRPSAPISHIFHGV